jgi:putative endonuclease
MLITDSKMTILWGSLHVSRETFILYNIGMGATCTITTGALGEELVVRYLRNRGYLIIFRNYSVENIGEIDIIAAKGAVLHFVEVKTSAFRDVLSPEHTVKHFDKAKKERTIHMMQRYCYRNNIQTPRCVDLAAVYVSRETMIARILYSENVYMDSI